MKVLVVIVTVLLSEYSLANEIIVSAETLKEESQYCKDVDQEKLRDNTLLKLQVMADSKCKSAAELEEIIDEYSMWDFCGFTRSYYVRAIFVCI